MREAIRLAVRNVRRGGGPFGAVIAREGRIVGRGANHVTTWNDPTAHAEVVAIRDACRKLKTFTLADCEIYTSCEPCPMCLAAIYWARIPRVYYGDTRADAARIGFDDALIYREVAKPLRKRQVRMSQLSHGEALAPFRAWQRKLDKVRY